MKSYPEVTTLLSVYNGEATLDRCIESVFSQTTPISHFVIINDGSVDKTELILEKWEKEYPEKIKIITHDSPQGLTRSLNEGLIQIHTPYIARIDADDWWQKEKIERQLEFVLSNPQYGLVGTNYTNVTSGNHFYKKMPETDEAIKKSIFKKNPFAHSTVLIKKSLLDTYGFYDESVLYGQDYELWLRLLPYTYYQNIQENLCMRTTGSGISVEKQRAQMWQGIKTQCKYIKLYRLPLITYFYILELLLVIISPQWLRNLRRKFTVL